jgi:hypothetical protein
LGEGHPKAAAILFLKWRLELDQNAITAAHPTS